MSENETRCAYRWFLKDNCARQQTLDKHTRLSKAYDDCRSEFIVPNLDENREEHLISRMKWLDAGMITCMDEINNMDPAKCLNCPCEDI